MSKTAHLSDERLRDLVVQCCDDKSRRTFRIRDIVDHTHCNQGNLSSWKNGKYTTSLASIRAARLFCDHYFTTHALPEAFAAAQEVAAHRVEKKTLGRRVKELLHPAVAPAAVVPRAVSARSTNAVVLSVATWNVKNLGASTPQERSARIAALLAWYDVTALQEIRKANLDEAFRPTLPDDSVGIVQMAPTGTRARRESTCFVYKRSSLEYVVGNNDFPTIDGCVYQPALATFNVLNPAAPDQSHGRRLLGRFSLLSVHISAGIDKEAKCREIERIQRAVRDFLNPSVVGDVIIVGDFNIEPSERDAFATWRTSSSALRPVMECGATTLSTEEHCYDHIWASNSNLHVDWRSGRAASMTDFVAPRVKASRRAFTSQVSDHLPVVVELIYDGSGVYTAPVPRRQFIESIASAGD